MTGPPGPPPPEREGPVPPRRRPSRRGTWRPLPPQEPPEPRPVGASLEALARRLGAAHPAALGAVFGHWSEVVGPPLASHARPVSLGAGVLTVEVDDPGAATHVRFLGPQLLARLAEVAGGPVAERVEVRVAGSRPARGR